MNNNLPEIFKKVVPEGACDRCFNTLLFLTPQRKLETCSCTYPEYLANPASEILNKSAHRLQNLCIEIEPQVFDLARILTNWTSQNPCKRDDLLELFFGGIEISNQLKLRRFHGCIETLRKWWLLPIGSRKNYPNGYWIITELADYKAWVERAMSAPITQLSTIHANAKFNYPIYAEQLELDFWTDMSKSGAFES